MKPLDLMHMARTPQAVSSIASDREGAACLASRLFHRRVVTPIADHDEADEIEGFRVEERPMLTAREWSWMVASAALAAMLVTAALFGTCEVLQGDCRIVWTPARTIVGAGQ